MSNNYFFPNFIFSEREKIDLILFNVTNLIQLELITKVKLMCCQQTLLLHVHPVYL